MRGLENKEKEIPDASRSRVRPFFIYISEDGARDSRSCYTRSVFTNIVGRSSRENQRGSGATTPDTSISRFALLLLLDTYGWTTTNTAKRKYTGVNGLVQHQQRKKRDETASRASAIIKPLATFLTERSIRVAGRKIAKIANTFCVSLQSLMQRRFAECDRCRVEARSISRWKIPTYLRKIWFHVCVFCQLTLLKVIFGN